MKSNTKFLIAAIIGIISIAIILSIEIFPLDNKSNELSTSQIQLYQGMDQFDFEPTNIEELLSSGRPLVINFWGASCPPCRKEIPLLQEIHEANSAKLIVLGLDMGPEFILGSYEQGELLLAELGASYPAGIPRFKQTNSHTAPYQLQGQYVTGLPTTFFINSEGKIIRQWLGLLSKDKLNGYKIISCPGCYPTSVQIPLIPLLMNKMINTNNIIIDSKSGFSGAGKNVKKKFKFKNLLSSVSAYGVGSHKHMPEIDQELSKIANRDVNIFFTPHLIPMFRGILTTIYVDTVSNNNAKKIYYTLKKYHKNNYFVKIAKFNVPIGTGDVINTNFCKISVCEDRKRKKVIIISAIDNLIKGGSGQAVQNMNVAYKFKETMGLI